MASPAFLGNVATFTLSGNDLSGDGNNIKLGVTKAAISVPTFNTAGWEDQISGLAKGTLDLNGYYDDAASKSDATIWNMLGGAGMAVAQAFVFNPRGNGVGKPTFTGNCFCTRYDVDTKPTAAVVFTSSFVVAASVTRATQ
ncbi:MAG TPA: hypothetical protein VGA61_04400 [Anaerolineae bacterium]